MRNKFFLEVYSALSCPPFPLLFLSSSWPSLKQMGPLFWMGVFKVSSCYIFPRTWPSVLALGGLGLGSCTLIQSSLLVALYKYIYVKSEWNEKWMKFHYKSKNTSYQIEWYPGSYLHFLCQLNQHRESLVKESREYVRVTLVSCQCELHTASKQPGHTAEVI